MSPVEGRRVPGPAAARRQRHAGHRRPRGESRRCRVQQGRRSDRARVGEPRRESLFGESGLNYCRRDPLIIRLLECIIYYNDYWIRYAHNVWHLACMSPACRALAVVVRTLRSSHLQIWLLPQGTRGDLHEQDGTRSVMCRESRRLSRRRVVCG